MILFLTSVIFDLLYGKLFRENKFKDIPRAIIIYKSENNKWVLINNLAETGRKLLFDTLEDLKEYCKNNFIDADFSLCCVQ